MSLVAGGGANLLGAVGGTAYVGEKLGLLALAVLAGAALVARPSRAAAGVRAGAMLAVLALTPALLLIDIWSTSQLRHVRAHPALAAAAGVGALLGVAALALWFRRRPGAFALAAVLALPFRLPISAGGGEANLLVPLYGVIAAGALAYVLAHLRVAGEAGVRGPTGVPGPGGVRGPGGGRAGEGAVREAGLTGGPGTSRVLGAVRRGTARLLSVRGLEWLLAAWIVLYALQAMYSHDFAKALQNVVFFYAPFALLFVLLRETAWTPRLLRACLGVALGLAGLLVAVGLGEYAWGKVLLNPKLVEANRYASYFRVNSLFYDPNIYGRFLALVMILLVVVVLSSGRRRRVLLGAAGLAWLWGGLLTSFSESSMIALLLGLAVLGAWRWNVRRTVYATLGTGAALLAVVLAAPPWAHLGASGEEGSANTVTVGRASLVRGGLSLFARRPLQGFGSGSFAVEYRAHRPATERSGVSASHTTAVTVAAEQGIVGLALYAALLVSAFAVLFGGTRRAPPGRAPGQAGSGIAGPSRIAVGAAFTVLVAHTFAYADFLEDPATWALLGTGAALAARGLPVRARSRAGWGRAQPLAVEQGAWAST